MSIYLLPLVFFVLRWLFSSLFCLPWSLFDPFLALVAMHAFFHGFEARRNIMFALFCGLVRDMTGLDTLGLYMLTYLATALAVALFSVIINRQSLWLVFPAVFVASVFGSHVALILSFWLEKQSPLSYSFVFLGRAILEAAGTTLVAYPLHHFSRRCGLTLTV